MKRQTRGYITLGILFFVIALTSVWYAASPTILEAQKIKNDLSETIPLETKTPTPRVGDYIVVHLDTMTLDLANGSTILETFPVISQGKPGSYYETIGGEYSNDYKLPNHFSSIGHVYMPWSIHVFGNFFIHGIPYYPDGTKVSSTYSGGCIRLSDEHAKRVYDFIQKGTPIIITRGDKDSFEKTPIERTTRTQMDMTRLMVAAISLEVLTQDNPITGLDGEKTTRRKLLPKLLVEGNDDVGALYAQALGERQFVSMMNSKAQALGLTNTFFTSTQEVASTTDDDYLRFMSYIDIYKSYLRKVDGQAATPQSAQ